MYHLQPASQLVCSNSPWQSFGLLIALPVAQLTIRAVNHVRQQGIKGAVCGLARSVAWLFPCVREKYQRKIGKQFKEFQKHTRKKWGNFGDPILMIPEKGLSDEQLRDLIRRYEEATLQAVGNQHLSGAIYSNSLREAVPETDFKGLDNHSSCDEIHTLAFRVSRLWNPLHTKEFAAGSFIYHQLVMMVASQFGSTPFNVTGYVTSGGTESLMTAARAYQQWGVREKGLAPEECFIVAPDSIHAALVKAQKAYNFQLVLVPTLDNGRVNWREFQQIARSHKRNLVAIFGSTPSYSKGVIDPIPKMGLLASELECGLHVDACLGFLHVDFVAKEEYLKMEGVTSLSADPHKYGLAPKGCSVLVTSQMPRGKNLAFYPVFSIPGWSGGIYGTATNAGSQSCVSAFCALLGLLKMGKAGYRKLAKEVHNTAIALHDVIDALESLKSLGQPDANVVAFRINPALPFEPGAIYAFTHLMEKRGFTCNNLAHEAAHFCVTPRNVQDPEFVSKFNAAAQASLIELAELNEKRQRQGTPFPGEAGIYGEIGAALEPSQASLSSSQYLENEVFGEMGANDAVAAYLVATSNPWLMA